MSTITKDRIKPGYIPPTPPVKVVLADPRYPQHRWPAHDAAVKAFFGLRPEQKWPDEGMPSIFIDTPGGKVQAFVISKDVAQREGRFQRCLCICPACSEVVPLGRLNQHWVVHE
jgi:hypothetical protein